jgi:hypothetical protein
MRSVGFHRLRQVLQGERRWEPRGSDDDEWGTAAWEKLFVRDGVTVNAKVGRGALDAIALTRKGRAIEPAALHPVTASELFYDLETATTKDGASRSAKPTQEKKGGLMSDEGAIEKGVTVKARRGTAKGKQGVVFWLGDGIDGPRCGIKTKRGDTVWANIADVAVVEVTAKAPAKAKPKPKVKTKTKTKTPGKTKAASTKKKTPAKQAPAKSTSKSIAKGARVAWRDRSNSGTGVVFWLGKNKFGDGMRAGVKDDETGETVWADAGACKVIG